MKQTTLEQYYEMFPDDPPPIYMGLSAAHQDRLDRLIEEVVAGKRKGPVTYEDAVPEDERPPDGAMI